MTSAPEAIDPQLSPETLALVAAVAETVVARMADAFAQALAATQQTSGELPPELRIYTAEQLAEAWGMKPSWFEQRAWARTGPSTKVGKFTRFSHEDVLEMLRAGQIGPRGKDLPRAA